jgi:taurine dioxygenase
MSVQLLHEPSTRQEGPVGVRPLSIHIGAEISDVDLSRPLAPEQVSAIRAALQRWKVVFFRGQSLDHRRHVAFARQFGETTAGHAVFGNDGEYPQIYSIAKHRKAIRHQGAELFRPWSGWHTDVTAAVNPPAASILRGEVVPPYGGDTQFTNLVAAYNALTPTMRAFVDGLRGIHRFAPPPGADATPEYQELVRKRILVSEHPLVRVHPESGERALFVSPSFLKSIVGLSPRESQVLLEFLWEHAVRPEFTVRFRWEPGSVAFWDNRATAHLAPRDIFDSDFDRQFYRVTLVGDVPADVDGKPSLALEGDPIAAV